MRINWKCLNRSDRNIGVWVAIYTSFLFITPKNPSPHHHPIAAPIAAFALILAAGVVAWLYSRKCNAA
jgi:hypothetical protein